MEIVTNLRTFYHLQPEKKDPIMEHIPFPLINATDGGSYHRHKYVQNQPAQLALVLLFELIVNIFTGNEAALFSYD